MIGLDIIDVAAESIVLLTLALFAGIMLRVVVNTIWRKENG